MAATAICLGMLALPAAASAANDAITVNTTADDFDVVMDGDCSLREAVQTANFDTDFGGCTQSPSATTGPDTITLPAGTYPLTGAAVEDMNVTGDLDVRNEAPFGTQPDEGGDLTLSGAGDGENQTTDTIIVGSTAPDRVIQVQSDGNNGMDLGIHNLTIKGGSVTGDGGGVSPNDPDGTLTLTGDLVMLNHATGNGGGVWFGNSNSGSSHFVSVTDTEFVDNGAGGEGGGLWVDSGSIDSTGANSVEVSGSTFTENGTDVGTGGAGGAIYLEDGTKVDLLNSTLFNNTATGGGAGVGLGGPTSGSHLYSQFSTIAGNSTTLASGAGGIQTDSTDDLVVLEGTILASNVAGMMSSSANCVRTTGTFTSTDLGYNLEFPASGSPTACGLTASGGNVLNMDPLLGSLLDNGGETRTRALGSNSPALNQVPNSPTDHCLSTENLTPLITTNLTTDQRGLPRPTDSSGLCDIGAFEVQPSGGSGGGGDTSGGGTTSGGTTTTPTGQRAAALKKCKKKRSARARRNCKRRANLLPV